MKTIHIPNIEIHLLLSKKEHISVVERIWDLLTFGDDIRKYWETSPNPKDIYRERFDTSDILRLFNGVYQSYGEEWKNDKFSMQLVGDCGVVLTKKSKTIPEFLLWIKIAVPEDATFIEAVKEKICDCQYCLKHEWKGLGWLHMNFCPDYNTLSEVKKENSVLYHIVQRSRLEEIRKKGLLPRYSNDEELSRIFLQNNKDLKKDVVALAGDLFSDDLFSEGRKDGINDRFILTVDLDKIGNDVKFYKNGFYARGWYVYDSIPPEAIMAYESFYDFKAKHGGNKYEAIPLSSADTGLKFNVCLERKKPDCSNNVVPQLTWMKDNIPVFIDPVKPRMMSDQRNLLLYWIKENYQLLLKYWNDTDYSSGDFIRDAKNMEDLFRFKTQYMKATVGYFFVPNPNGKPATEYEVFVLGSECNTPHLHIWDKATEGRSFHTCIELFLPEYFNAIKESNTFTYEQRDAFIRFLSEKCRDEHFSSHWEFALSMWNHNNPERFKVDEHAPVPDYGSLAIHEPYTEMLCLKPINTALPIFLCIHPCLPEHLAARPPKMYFQRVHDKKFNPEWLEPVTIDRLNPKTDFPAKREEKWRDLALSKTWITENYEALLKYYQCGYTDYYESDLLRDIRPLKPAAYRFYMEASHDMEKGLLDRYDCVPIPAFYAKEILKLDDSAQFEPTEDGFHYRRTFGIDEDPDDRDIYCRCLYGVNREDVEKGMISDYEDYHKIAAVKKHADKKENAVEWARSIIIQLSGMEEEDGMNMLTPTSRKYLEEAVAILEALPEKNKEIKDRLWWGNYLLNTLPDIKLIPIQL